MPLSKSEKRQVRPAPLTPATEAFLRKDEFAFQRVCAEAYSHEPNISSCSIYGTRGQKQHGVDLIAYCRDGDQIELVQCKRYGAFGVRELESAIREFHKADKHWEKKMVRRFVVVTSADISDRHLQDAILARQKISQKKKIIFAVWGCAELCSKLSPHRGAVQDIYGGEDTDRICGPVAETPAWRAAERMMRETGGNILVELESERTAQLEELRELSREGRHGEALKRALRINHGPAWTGYNSELRARFLRFAASMRLNLGEPVADAVALVEQAKALHPQLDYQIIDSYIAGHRYGITRALEQLGQPTSLDAWNMRWAFLMESRRAEEVWSEFNARGATFTLNAETHRLLALAALLTDDLVTAQAEIARAQALGPKHRNIRVAGAIIDYRSSLAPSADAGANLNWPTPVNWAFVRRDPQTLDRLKRASAEFAALRATAGTREEALFEVWELGCIACDPTRADEAEKFAQKRLREAPDDFRVAAWAVERDYTFDRVAVAVAIAAAIQRNPEMGLDARLACCAVLLSDRKITAAEKALDDAEASFEAQGQHDVWKLQKVQFLAQQGRPTAKVVESIADPRLHSQAMITVLRIGKHTRAELLGLAKAFTEEYTKTGVPSLLFQACDTYHRSGEPKFIADHAKELVEKMGTDSALRLALNGAFAAGHPDLCLELLRENQAVLQGGRLSPELRRLRAACLQKIGQLDEAIRTAEALYRERPEPETFGEFFRMLIQAGDTRRAAEAARDLLSLPKVDVALLLQVANFTRLHDMKLAQQLWRKAAAKPLKTTELLAGVVALAFTLGTENEAGALQQRLFKRANKTGQIQVKTLEEVRGMMRERQEQQLRLSTSYDRSEAPIHLIAPPIGAPLVQLYHGKLEENRSATDLTQVPALLARYGGRTLSRKVGSKVLFADITGLILAADLEILDLVEEHLGPVYIAPETPQSLVQQVGECRPHQPSQHSWQTQLQQMVAAGDIIVVDVAEMPVLAEGHPLQPLGPDWQVAWQTAQNHQAVLGTDWPLLSDEGNRQVFLPEALTGGMANLRELLNAAQTCGVLTAEEVTQHVGAVGVFRNYPARPAGQPSFPAGTVVLLSSVPLEIIANQGLLKAVAKAFRVRILRSDFKRIAEEECAYAKRMELADWTQALVDRIKAGIAAGRYKVLPQRISAKLMEKMGLDAVGLGNLLGAIEGNAQASLWCDDRSINRHALAGSKPPVDILDVMGMLRNKGVLSKAIWYEKLTQLRRSNVRYIPTSAEEIGDALKLAAVENGMVVETGTLATLRRYYAACLLERGRLIGPKQGAQDLQEWHFILQVRQATDAAFRELWEQDLPEGIIQAQAEWLWRWLHVDMVGLRFTVVKEMDVQEERELTAFQIGSLFSSGIGLPFRSVRKGVASARERCFDWLNTMLLKPLEHANPGFIESVAHIVAKDIERTCRKSLKLSVENRRKGELLLTAKLFMDLPLELQEHVNLSADVLAGLGVKVHEPSVDFEGHQIDLAELSAAQAEALEKGSATFADRDRAVEWKLDCDPAKVFTLNVTCPDGQVKMCQNPEFAVLLPKVVDRMDRLEYLAYFFDCDEVTRRAAIQEICIMENPVDRVLRLNEWRNDSPQVLYRELNRLLQEQKEVSLSDLQISSWRRLVQHLHLPSETVEAVSDLEAAAASLLKDDGLQATLRCFMAMPRRLPASIETAWCTLPESEAKELWEKLPRFPRSVVTDLHLVRLAQLRDDIDRSIVERVLTELFDREKGEELVESFFGVLRWVESEFSRWPQRYELPPWQRLLLVWYHASKLHGIFKATQVDLSKMDEFFRANTSSWHHGVMDYDLTYARDLSHPNLAGAGSVLLNGLANLLEGLPETHVDAIGVSAKWRALTEQDAQYTGGMLLDLCRRTDLASDILGSFLANSSQAMRNRLLGNDWDSGLKLAGGNIPLSEIIAMAAKDPFGIEGWSALLASVRGLSVPEENRGALRELLASIDWDKFMAKAPDWARVVMNFSAAQARSLGMDFHKQFEEILFKFSDGLTRMKMTAEEARYCDLHLAQSLLALSIEPGDQIKTATTYFEKIGRLMRVRPAVASVLDRHMWHWLNRLPFEQQRGLRALWYQLRAQC